MKRAELKRTGPLRTKNGLRSDPEKVRQFVDRGRVTAARALRDARAKELRSDVIPPAQQRRPRSTRVQFRAARPARTQTCAWPGCGRTATSWHHWLTQEAIRVYARGLRLPEQEERRLLSKLLRDERNLSPFCSKHHGAHGTTSHEFCWPQVPASACEFARELGREWYARLRRAYPDTRVRRLQDPPERAA